MKDILKQTGSLQPKELEAIYSISRTVTDATSIESALDEMVRVLRPVFIFDNIVLYSLNPEGILGAHLCKSNRARQNARS